MPLPRLYRSEEDNEGLTDDGASSVSVPAAIPRKDTPRTSTSKPHPRKHQLAASVLSDTDSVDSPTYDGDIESTIPTPITSVSRTLHQYSSVSTLNSPGPGHYSSSQNATPSLEPADPIATGMSYTQPLVIPDEPAVPSASKAAFNPSKLTPDDIRAFVQKAIDGESWRKYKINPPATDRQIRVYADGTSYNPNHER